MRLVSYPICSPASPVRPAFLTLCGLGGFASLLLGLLLLLPGGARAQTNGAPVARTATTALPESELAHIGPADVLVVTVYQEDDLNTRVTVDGKGMVSLPLLGSVKVGGYTTDQAAAAIRDLYGKDYLVNPQVTVAIGERAKRRFTVLGQVTKPGVYEFPPNESVNLLQAIAMAGGYTRLASPSKVTLQRQDASGTRSFKLDAGAMAKDTQTPPFPVLPDDVITVGERII